MLKIIEYLHEERRENVRQSELSRSAYAISVNEVLNATVRADMSRVISQMLKEEIIEETEPNRFRLADRGAAILLVKPKTQILVPLWTSRRKGVRKKK